ncbi:MAG: rhomboid family intramembrane serine protease [Crocinitomicaceae bacterium]|nr:rhomboid family intramembrane serine protease [Crocinitomicaceae bacterium]
MQQDVWQNIKNLYKRYGMISKLITINLCVFIFFGLLGMIQFLFKVEGLVDNVGYFFAGPANPEDLLYRPWTLVTQLFTHVDFLHLLFNMIMLFFTAQIFVQFFGEKRLLTTYILGGICGYLLHIGFYYGIPAFQEEVSGAVIGASGAIYAIFAAIAYHRPSLSVYLFGMIRMPIVVLAVVFVLGDVFAVGKQDHIAHLAHIGGALFGVISVINVNSPTNFMNRFEKWLSRFKLKGLFKRKPKMKIYSQEEVQQMDDDQYREEKKVAQERIDDILEKISKKGYESLTKEEKEILFNESKRK